MCFVSLLLDGALQNCLKLYVRTNILYNHSTETEFPCITPIFCFPSSLLTKKFHQIFKVNNHDKYLFVNPLTLTLFLMIVIVLSKIYILRHTLLIKCTQSSNYPDPDDQDALVQELLLIGLIYP